MLPLLLDMSSKLAESHGLGDGMAAPQYLSHGIPAAATLLTGKACSGCPTGGARGRRVHQVVHEDGGGGVGPRLLLPQPLSPQGADDADAGCGCRP